MTGFADRLAPDLTTIALCWRVARSDGITLGFTTHDQGFDLEGVRYAASPGMAASAIGIGGGLDVDTMEVDGVLSADAITAGDLAAGRYDGAVVAVFMVDWSDLGPGRLPLVRGTIGEVERRLDGQGGAFTATLRGPTAAFEAVAIEACSPDCRAEFGDRRCRVDLAPRTWPTVALASTRDSIAVAIDDPDRFAQGRLRAQGGDNAGIDARIAGVVDGRLILFEPLPFDLAVGTRLSLREGCDKRLATCSARFANAINFRGEPHVPGGDVLTRFPGV